MNDPAALMEVIGVLMYLMPIVPIVLIAGFFLITGLVKAIMKWLKFANATYGEAIAIVLAGAFVSMAIAAPIMRIGLEVPPLLIVSAIIGSYLMPFFGFTAGTWIISRESVGKCFGLTALLGVVLVVVAILLVIVLIVVGIMAGMAGA